VSLVGVLREMDAARTIDPVHGAQVAHVQRWLDHAAEHLRTAASVVESDPAMALEAVHQACRKSLVAHMAAAGWRPAGTNKHALMVEYGRAALAEAFTASELDGLDIIRRLRNIADYDDPTPPSAEQLRALIGFASRIHDACVNRLPAARVSLR
jgi:HEPN domain-containing protein